jgi:hypothetical protein
MNQLYLKSTFHTSYAPFLLLNNLRKDKSKFKHLLKNLIAETFFLIYAYKTIILLPNYCVHFDFAHKMILNKINLK